MTGMMMYSFTLSLLNKKLSKIVVIIMHKIIADHRHVPYFPDSSKCKTMQQPKIITS
jgi:hypothetical protein